MDYVYDSEISSIQWLQTRFHDQSEFFCFVSKVFAPRYAFLFLVPLIYSLDNRIGKRILLVAIISEWTNQLMKWILQEERPYWWVHETTLYKLPGRHIPNIEQYSITCETAPGNPSAHCLCATSVWYVVFEAFLQKVDPTSRNYNRLCMLCWSVYTLIILAVASSRVFLATHFPHQCILGVVIGFLVIKATNRIPVNKMKFKHYLILTTGLFSSSVLTYVILKMVGSDPIWSMHKALQWCAKKDYVNSQTTPLYFIMRYCGFALGLGIGLNSTLYKQMSGIKFTIPMKMFCALLSLGVVRMCGFIVLPKSGVYSYIVAFCLNVFIPYMFITVIPFTVRKSLSFVRRIKKP